MLPPSRKEPLLGRYSAEDRATLRRAPAAGTGANSEIVRNC
ncbi:hypothetical protein E5U26_28815 [Burkholderia pseudomallei]|nr:hypothetical protein [Burkholderia pseudomallei]